MPAFPRDDHFDMTLPLLRDPYRLIARRCRELGSDLFEARLMLRRTICMTGPEAARLFYDPDRFIRQDAMPIRVRRTLLGEGGVQGLDGGAHRNRKEMFLGLMTPEGVERLVAIAREEWERQARRWVSEPHVVLFDASQEILTRAVCRWAGVPLADEEAAGRARLLAALFDHAGRVGPKHWQARLARKRADSWMARFIEDVRAGRIHPLEDSAAAAIAHHRDADGQLMAPRVAAVELLNLLRPTVAVAVYVAFVVHALSHHPESGERLRTDEDGFADRFVQEVRRVYPFFPAVVARVAQDFEWRGFHFPRHRRVMLDLYGSNLDPRSWDEPGRFRPDRFRTWTGDPFALMPQGGGDHRLGHRCPGEWITIGLMKLASEMLGRRLRYRLPDQDIELDWSRLPALPRSRVVLADVRLTD